MHIRKTQIQPHVLCACFENVQVPLKSVFVSKLTADDFRHRWLQTQHHTNPDFCGNWRLPARWMPAWTPLRSWPSLSSSSLHAATSNLLDDLHNVLVLQRVVLADLQAMAWLS